MTLQDYWNDAHRSKDLLRLSGHSLALHEQGLGVGALINGGSPLRLLAVGVGDGRWLVELTNRGHWVAVLDVCAAAVGHVPRGCPLFLSPQLLPENCFDGALSLWVTSHLDTPTLQEQLRCVFQSLLLHGIFALHYTAPGHGKREDGCEPNVFRSAAASMHRLPGTMRRLVEEAGGTVIKDELLGESPRLQLDTRYLHARRVS